MSTPDPRIADDLDLETLAGWAALEWKDEGLRHQSRHVRALVQRVLNRLREAEAIKPAGGES